MSTPRTNAERVLDNGETAPILDAMELVENDFAECMEAIDDALNYWYPLRGDSEIEHAARKRLKAFYDAKKEGGK